MSKLYIMIGIPASGKDWYIEHHKKDGDVVLSSDAIRAEFGDVNDQSQNQLVFSTLYKRMRTALYKQKDVWFNATNVTAKNRSYAIKCGKQYNAEIIGIMMLTPLEQCIENEKLRERKVGVEVMNKFIDRFENPLYTEGFSKIITVMEGKEYVMQNVFDVPQKVDDNVLDYNDLIEKGLAE